VFGANPSSDSLGDRVCRRSAEKETRISENDSAAHVYAALSTCEERIYSRPVQGQSGFSVRNSNVTDFVLQQFGVASPRVILYVGSYLCLLSGQVNIRASLVVRSSIGRSVCVRSRHGIRGHEH